MIDLTSYGHVLVKRRHFSQLRYCAKGSRYFFKLHGLDWSDFLRNGVPASKFLEINDAQVNKAVHLAVNEYISKGTT